VTEKTSISLAGDLGQPAVALIEKISAAVGWIAAPAQITRMAQAEAKAARIKALARVEVDAIEARAKRRLAYEDLRHQRNIEAISRLAVDEIKNTARPQEIDGDWIAHFFERSKIVSNQDMQILWGRILAGEANSPGMFSRRTLELVSGMDARDAKYFQAVVRAAQNSLKAPLIFQADDAILLENGISFVSIKHLEAIGLILFDMSSGFALIAPGQTFEVEFPDKKLILKSEQNKLYTGVVSFTRSGAELAAICNVEPISEFTSYVEKQLKSRGYTSIPLITEVI